MKNKLVLLAALSGLFLSATLLAQPAIGTQPTNQTVSVGASVQFRVTVASGTPNLQFQWCFKDTALDPVLNPSSARNILRLTNVMEAMTGDYWAVVTDDNGSTPSDKARLTVDPTFAKVTKGAIVEDREASVTGTWCDYDNDGFPDLFVGSSIYPNSSTCSLYHNNKDGTFERVTNSITTRLDVAMGSAWADCDNDGTADLYVVHYAANRVNTLYRGIGAGDFTPGTAVPLQAQSGALDAAWGDIDNDGWLDLFVNTGVSGANDSLLRNAGAGQLVALTSDQAGAVVTNHAWTVSAAWCDFDNDGDADLFVSNHEGPSFLYRNDGTGHFENIGPTLLPTVGSATCGTWADMNNDGFFDLLVTTGQANKLYLNQNGQSFSDVTEAAGVALTGRVWGPAWGDYDNDGDVDLFVPDYDKTNAFFANKGDGTFIQVDVGSLLRDGFRDECASWADYDQDGFLDLFIPCGEGSPSPNLLYHNNLPATGNRNHWLAVQLRGQVANRMGIGAKVRVRAQISGREVWQVRQIASNGAIASGAELIAHFGLGDATKAELIRIEWPSGNVQELTDYDANSLYTFTEPVRIQPVRPSASPGGAVTLTCVGSAASYRWRFNGVDLPGETKRTLSLTNITIAMAGRYSVAVTAADGTTSTHFTYLNVDPMFTKIPSDPVVTDPVTSQKPAASWGAAWGDYDNDGFIDLAMGYGIPGEGTTGPAVSNKLYRNRGDGTFQPVADSVVSAGVGYSSGCGWADADNDGFLDLYIGEYSAWYSAAQQSHPYFFRNLGNGNFAASDAIPSPIGREVPGLPVWGDWNNDGWVDLFVVSAWNSFRATNSLYLNMGTSGFTRIWDSPVGNSASDAQWAAWSDYDNDGLLDLLVTYLRNPVRLYHNEGGGVFSKVASSTIYQETSSAGAAWGDYDNDGVMDLCLVSYFGNLNLFHQEANGEFTRTILQPAGNYQMPNWVDYDNDGHLDLFVTMGYGSGDKKNHLYRNQGDGTFVRVTTGSPCNDGGWSNGTLWGDYDNNGFQDLLVLNGYKDKEPNYLYRNNGNGNSWLTLKLVGTASNRSGIGAKVRVRASIAGKGYWQMREFTRGNGNGDDLRPHFGLGNATKADTVRIEWPSGIVQEFTNVPAKQILTVTEPTQLVALGEGRIWVRCWKGMKYEVEVSNDLTAWTSLGVFTNETGRLEVTDAGAAGQPYRFYRAIER